VALALVNDQFHQRAVKIQQLLRKDGRVPLTTDYVLVEVFNFLAGRAGIRAVSKFNQSMQNSDLEIIYQGKEGFKTGRKTLLKYKDKDFSLTDCASFNVMWQFGIADVFTFDRHFEQVGFRIIE